MKSKYLLLVGLLPLFYSCNKNATIEVIDYQNSPIVVNEEEDGEDESCTVMYVGKNVSTNGKAIIARTSDAGPGAMMINTTIFPHNSLANQTITSNKGFSYKMPSTTYRYISTPRNSVIHKGHYWEASAINECGVGVSATLSCYCNENVKKVDPLVEGGISEDNIAQIVGATAKTAREGIEIIAKIINEQGAQDPNAVMTIDQNEAWYMEIYSGHQYAAVKCPDDKILTAGNEFVFDSLDHMNISQENVIFSKELLTKLADVEGVDKRKFDEGFTDLRHLKLAETYAAPYSDGAHTRTWRGYSKFTSQWPDYNYLTHQKYDAFYTPNKSLSIHDVTEFMRDRYENILAGPNDNPTTLKFREWEASHQLRYIGIENAYQIHIIQSDKDLPKDLAATEWLSISNANYTPFVPINCSINNMSKYYTKVSPIYSYDEGSAANIFKKLNTLARNNREYYGHPVEDFWIMYENIYDSEYNELIKQVKDLDVSSRYDIMTNYVTKTQENAVKTALFMIDDLTWHMMNDSFDFGTPTKFNPCVNVEDYALKHGYNYEKSGRTVKFAKGEEKYSLTLINEEYRPSPETKYDYRSLGEITYGDIKENIDMVIKDSDVYVPLNDLSKYIKGDITINMNSYRTPFNHIVWIVPVVIAIPVISGLVFYFIRKRRKENR